MELGAKLKMILSEKGLSQNVFADSLGVDRSHMSKIINDKSMPTIKMLERFAEELNIPITTFFAEPDESTNELIASSIMALPEDLKDFIRAQKNGPWLYLAKDLSVENLTPDQIIKVVQLWKETVEKSK